MVDIVYPLLRENPSVNYCDVCGNEFPGDLDTMGVSIGMMTRHQDPAFNAAVARYMEPYKTNRIYQICFPCWLKSLGVKP